MPDTSIFPVVNRTRLTTFAMCCGSGGQSIGFGDARIRMGGIEVSWECLGGIDTDPAAIRDFTRLTGAPGTVMDLFTLDQYRDFHGAMPPPGWREATLDDIRRAAKGQNPDCITISAPCKGLSGLLSEKVSATLKYQALNRLTIRCVELALAAFADDPPSFFLFENVPRLYTRGRHLVDQILETFRAYGYAARETAHCCGEIGNLAQGRKRALIVARHIGKVPDFLYEPVKHRLRGVGEVIGLLPLPGDPTAGPMHRVPSLTWQTWVRLAFVPAGKDWRALNDLAVVDGQLRDWGIAPVGATWREGVLGVGQWQAPTGTVTSRSSPTNGTHSVADPRAQDLHGGVLGVKDWDQAGCTVTSRSWPLNGTNAVADPRPNLSHSYNQLGVGAWDQPAATVTSQKAPGQGRFSVADPRRLGGATHNNVFRVVAMDQPSPTITAGHGPSSGGICVADPRPAERSDYTQTKYRVTRYDEPSNTVIAASTTGNGAYAVADPHLPWGSNAHQSKMAVRGWEGPARTVTGSDRVGSGAMSVADPRPAFLRDKARRDSYQTGGHYGILDWEEPSRGISAHPKNNNGFNSVADPRASFAGDQPPTALPRPNDRMVALIVAPDGTWHRPFTTLDLAALQSFFDVEAYAAAHRSWRRACRIASERGSPLPPPPEPFDLDGNSDSAKRERIGNAVPPAAARAIAEMIGRTLLLARMEVRAPIAKTPVWVQPVAAALALPQGSAPL